MGGIDVNAAAARIQAEFQKIGQAQQRTGAGDKGSFGKMLDGFLDETNELQTEADGAVHKLMTGETNDVHEVMTAMAKADVSFRMMLEVRNKLMDAYQEVMRMQV